MTTNFVHIDDIEELVIAKYFIECDLIKNNEIDDKMTIAEFIQKFINMTTNVVIYNMSTSPKIVPFYIYEYGDNKYVFLDNENEYSDLTIMKLKKLKYDLTGLPAYSGGDTLLRIGQKEYDF